MTIRVTDLLGRVMLDVSHESGHTFEVDIKNLASGKYILLLMRHGKTKTGKFFYKIN